MILIDQLTLVIPTHNRPNHLKRLLSYLGTSIRVVVADSSHTNLNSEILNSGNAVFTNVSPDTSFPAKIYQALQAVETPYVQLCADDDFPMLSTSRECVAALSADATISSLCGLTLAFSQQRGSMPTCWPRYLDKVFWKNESDDHLSRFKKVYLDYYQFFYGVHRLDTLKKTFKLSSTHQHKRGWEIDVTLMSSIVGRQYVLRAVGSVREAMPKNRQINPNPTVNDWIQKNKDSAKMEDWVNAHKNFLTQHGVNQGSSSVDYLLRCPIFDLESDGVHRFLYKVFSKLFISGKEWPPIRKDRFCMWVWDFFCLNRVHGDFVKSDEWKRLKSILEYYGPLDATKYDN